jgi:DNA-binding transcriptional LysR family regulator
MLKDFSKLNTFLTVAKEKSFSKASSKIGISQPAVTQQIKFIEEYLQCKILERKKNGIILTKEGNELYKIAVKLEKFIAASEKELMSIVNNDMTMDIGSCYTIGTYILPGFQDQISGNIGTEVHTIIAKNRELIRLLQDKKIDIALLADPVQMEGVFYREWLDDEVVMFSNAQLPKTIKPEDMKNYSWIVREAESSTRKVVEEALEDEGIDCSAIFDIKTVLTDSTAIKQMVLRAPVSTEKPTASIVSKHVIANEVKAGMLTEARIKGQNFKRKLYIAYLKENKHDAHITNVVNFLMKQKV